MTVPAPRQPIQGLAGAQPYLLRVQTHEMPASLTLSGHTHVRPHLMIVSAGEVEESIGSTVHALTAGSVRISGAHTEHELRFGSAGATCTIFGSAGDFWNRVFLRAAAGRASAFAAIHSDDAVRISNARSVVEIAQSRAALVSFGRAIASVERCENQRAPSWIDDALDALENGMDRPIKDIARLVRRDRIHFARAFAAHLGLRPSEYRTVRRLGMALSALCGQEPNLSEIALASGYAHQSHMNHDFRAVLGSQPTVFSQSRRAHHSCKTRR